MDIGYDIRRMSKDGPRTAIVPSFVVVAQGMGLSLTIGPIIHPTAVFVLHTPLLPLPLLARTTTAKQLFFSDVVSSWAFHFTLTSLHFIHSPLTLAHIVRLFSVDKIEKKEGEILYSADHGVDGRDTYTHIQPIVCWVCVCCISQIALDGRFSSNLEEPSFLSST